MSSKVQSFAMLYHGYIFLCFQNLLHAVMKIMAQKGIDFQNPPVCGAWHHPWSLIKLQVE